MRATLGSAQTSIAAMCIAIACVAAAEEAVGKPPTVQVPSQRPGIARASAQGGRLCLENDSISMAWDTAEGTLRPVSIVDRFHGHTWPQTGCDVFHIGTGTAPEDEDSDSLYVGMRIRDGMIDAMISRDGHSWHTAYQHHVSARSGVPGMLRVGKMDMQGGTTDYVSKGEDGICRLDSVRILRDQGAGLAVEDFDAELNRNTWRTHLSAREGTSVKAAEGELHIATGGNCAACIERPLPDETRFASCRVWKDTDKGMSWGPGIALAWSDGEFVVCGVRNAREVNIHTRNGERILGIGQHKPMRFDVNASRFTIEGKPRTEELSETRSGNRRTGKAVCARLVDQESRVSVNWRGVLWDGAHYVRQEFTFTGPEAGVPVNCLELLHCRIGDAAQVGSVTGSPAATEAMFAGVELPVAGISAGGTDDLRGVFACDLTFTDDRPYTFSTVVGVYAAGQLRRSFLSYVEAERARPSRPFLHYNCWYDLGYGINAARIANAAEQFRKNLVEPFGVNVESYVLDDGWDDFHCGLWVTNLKRFPDDFTGLSKQLAENGSRMGIWISPLGGYGGDKQRTALAKEMGLITGDTLDLSEDAYYQWFRDKCRSLMLDCGVNYFKWDKAGHGASPHFMALLSVARELREVNPDVFINVTVGTWPSPFWLNHIDCTWRGLGGDVGWIGKGDDREQWITGRDHFCYRAVVTRAPLYPLNSIMHHGIVHGRAFQGARVAKAGPNLKNEARSYFGAGSTLQELYLTPSLMTETSWRQVGESARWAHSNADVLLDSHWIGGEPGKLEPYGYASWSPRKGILCIRNPDDAPQTFDVDIQEAFELPEEAPRKYRIRNAYADQDAAEDVISGGTPYTFVLRPFEVLVFECDPAR